MKYVSSLLMLICMTLFTSGSIAWANDDENEQVSEEITSQPEPAQMAENSQDEADRFDDQGNPIGNGENDQTAGVSKMCQDGTNQSNICKRQRETDSA